MHVVGWTCVAYEQFEFGGSDVIVLFLLSWLKAGLSGPEKCILLNRFEVFMFPEFIWVTYGKFFLNFTRNTLG